MEGNFFFSFKRIAEMALFVAGIIREGLTYKVTPCDDGFEITLTGGF